MGAISIRYEYQYDCGRTGGYLVNYERHYSDAEAIEAVNGADRIFNLGYEEPVQIWERTAVSQPLCPGHSIALPDQLTEAA